MKCMGIEPTLVTLSLWSEVNYFIHCVTHGPLDRYMSSL